MLCRRESALMRPSLTEGAQVFPQQSAWSQGLGSSEERVRRAELWIGQRCCTSAMHTLRCSHNYFEVYFCVQVLEIEEWRTKMLHTVPEHYLKPVRNRLVIMAISPFFPNLIH